MGSTRRFVAGDEGGEFFFKLLEKFLILDLFPFLRGDVKGVHCDAFLGANPGVCGVQAMLVDGVEEVVK